MALARKLVAGTDPRLPRHACSHRAAIALLRESAGQPAALEQHADAARAWQEYGSLLEHGHALFGMGRCALLVDDPRAAQSLTTARELFAGLGAWRLVAEVDTLLPGAEQQRSS